MDKFAEFFNIVAKGLSHKAEALLIFALAVITTLLIWLSVNPWLACSFSAGLYIIYVLRAERSEAHDERMAEKDIQKIEQENRARLTQRKARLIAKRNRR